MLFCCIIVLLIKLVESSKLFIYQCYSPARLVLYNYSSYSSFRESIFKLIKLSINTTLYLKFKIEQFFCIYNIKNLFQDSTNISLIILIVQKLMDGKFVKVHLFSLYFFLDSILFFMFLCNSLYIHTVPHFSFILLKFILQ